MDLILINLEAIEGHQPPFLYDSAYVSLLSPFPASSLVILVLQYYLPVFTALKTALL